MKLQIDMPKESLAEFCRRWKIVELSLFGSVLRDDFSPDSDIDVLVTFETDAGWSGFDLVDMTDELQAIFDRKVDLVEKSAIRNPFRRKRIMDHNEVVYAA